MASSPSTRPSRACCSCAKLLSPHPHARVRSIDASEAEKLPGVVKVLHRGNAPEEYIDVRIGSGPPDRYIFSDEVFEVGTPIASVAADSDHIADEALRLIKVEYEILPAVTDHIEAMKSSTPKQWNNKLDGTILEVGAPKIRGNPDQGFAESEIVIENVTTRSSEQHVRARADNPDCPLGTPWATAATT